MASSFKNEDGAKIVYDMIQAIQDNKQYLSDIDGLIGDGDHGINMNKGFTMCKEALDQEPGNMSASLKTLSNVLMEDIGGSMGPLYGCIFRAMFRASKGKEDIDKDVFKEMITKAEEGIRNIGGAEVGDKTLLDTVAPAAAAYCAAVDGGDDFATALTKMKAAAEALPWGAGRRRYILLPAAVHHCRFHHFPVAIGGNENETGHRLRRCG